VAEERRWDQPRLTVFKVQSSRRLHFIVNHKLTPLVRVGRRFGIRTASNQDCGRSAHYLRSTRLFAVASATSQPVQWVGPSINVAALPNPPDEGSDIAASLQRLGLGE
jgi:hypothetical protein